MMTKVKFVILLILLALLFSPLVIMFFTSFIPEGDPFHLVVKRKINDFQAPIFLLRMKTRTLGGLKWNLVKEGNNSCLEVRLEPSKVQGVGFTTGSKNVNTIKGLSLRIKTDGKVRVAIALKDANGEMAQTGFRDVDTGGDWKTISLEMKKDELEGIDLERITRVFVVFESERSAEVLLDDLYFVNRFPTLYNFYYVLTHDEFGRYMINSAIVSGIVVLGNMIFSSMVGYAFARRSFFMKEILFAIILGMMMIPPQTTIIPVFILMKKLGWIDTYWALTVPALVTPFGVFLMRQYIEQIPVELDQAARVDGASDFQIFWRIILPLSKAPLAVLGINTFIGAWNDLFYPLILTTSKEMRTVQLGLALYQKLNTAWPSLMAASTIAGLPVIIVYLIFQKRIIAGILQGALKG